MLPKGANDRIENFVFPNIPITLSCHIWGHTHWHFYLHTGPQHTSLDWHCKIKSPGFCFRLVCGPIGIPWFSTMLLHLMSRSTYLIQKINEKSVHWLPCHKKWHSNISINGIDLNHLLSCPFNQRSQLMAKIGP